MIGAFLGKVFGESKNIEKGLDMLEGAGDALFFTPEEKSQANMKKLEWRLQWIKAIGPQSKARRYLTYVIAGIWLHHVILSTYLYIFAIIWDKPNVMIAAGKVFDILLNVISPVFLLTAAFYYAANVVRSQSIK